MLVELLDLILSWFRGPHALGEVVFADCNRASPLGTTMPESDARVCLILGQASGTIKAVNSFLL